MRNVDIAHIELTEKEIGSAVEVLESGYLREGPKCQALEEAFAELTGAEQALTAANGTAALHLAYEAILEPGDQVLVPSFTFIATASAVALAGGEPIFCDVDPETFLIDLDDAASRVTDRTTAIAPVHLFGNPCDADAVGALARDHDLRIVWDAAQAHGATYDGRDVGSFDDFVCYSFYPTKNMFVGEGGMVCVNDGEIMETLELIRSHGQEGQYYHTRLGYNYRMTDVEAAIGLAQLERFEDMLETRRRNDRLLREGLEDAPGIRVQRVTDGGRHACHQFCVVVEPEAAGCDRDELSEQLAESGVSTGVHYPRGLHQQPVFEESRNVSSLPVTEELAQKILALPVHHGMSAEDARYVARVVREACG